jgi:hypothetical protein
MKRLSRIIVTAALGAVAFGTFASTARASCVPSTKNDGVPWRLHSSRGQLGTFAPVLAQFAPDTSAPDLSIVGFWQVDFVAKDNTNGIPDGTPIDSAYVQWHSDGTEIMNSSRDPRTQSFCLGVWKKTGPFSYTLKHRAMTWTSDGTPIGPATILENVTLARRGDTFTGTFVIVQYEMDGITISPPTPIFGTLRGTRITAD